MKPLFWCLCFLFCVASVTVGNFDLVLSAIYYTNASGWIQGRDVPWRWLYDYGTVPAIVMAASGAVGLLGSWRWREWIPHRRRCAFLVLVVALGPGLVVNGILKPGWGRPRPRDVAHFGGYQTYHAWWQPAGPGRGKSFPSGHAAMGFVLVAGVVLVPCRRRVWRHVWLTGSLSYSGGLGWARIVQGGHFLSDVVWSGGVVGIVIWGLYVSLKPDRADEIEWVCKGDADPEVKRSCAK